MNVKRKKLLLTVGVFILIAIAAAVIKFMPEKSLPVAKALPQKNTAAAGKTAVKVTAKVSAAVQPEVNGNEQQQEQKAEREDADIHDTPEKATMRASLENDIRALSEKKEKDSKEFSVLMKSFDDAISNSQLPPEELKNKQSEIEVVKKMLMSAYDQKMSSTDSSLKKKVEQYRELTQD